MLGEKILEEAGKISSTRVLESSPVSKIETTFEAHGKLLGIEHRTIATYWTVILSSGMLYGEGQGVVMTKDGVAKWTGSGAGKFLEKGGMQFRGALYYQTTVESLRRLNGLAVIYEYEVDANGVTNTTGFEWK